MGPLGFGYAGVHKNLTIKKMSELNLVRVSEGKKGKESQL